jgi:hypothetical protein
MKASTRTILAFIIAPAIAPMIVGIIQACTRREGEGPTWIASFGQYFSVAAVVTYAVSYTLGTVTFFALRALKKESVLYYGAVGAAAGILWGLLGGLDPQALVLAGFLGALGCSVATAFALIRGVSKKKGPNQSPHPTLASGLRG